jgi:hypothetical protein
MRATVSLPDLLRVASRHRNDCVLVAQGSQCVLRSDRSGVRVESILEANAIEPGRMLIPHQRLKALRFVDDKEVTFFEDERSSGYTTPRGASLVESPSTARSSTEQADTFPGFGDSNPEDPGRPLPPHLFRRALRILQDRGAIRVRNGIMFAGGPQGSVVVRSGNFDGLTFDIVPVAVDPLAMLVTSNNAATLRTSARTTTVHAGDSSLTWLTGSGEPFNLETPLPTCMMRVLRSDFQRLLQAAGRYKRPVVLSCDPARAELLLEAAGSKFPLKARVLAGLPVRVLIQPAALCAHVALIKGAEIEFAVGSRWIQLRGAEVVPGRWGEMLEVVTFLIGEPVPLDS